jgi:hypothetical protein
MTQWASKPDPTRVARKFVPLLGAAVTQIRDFRVDIIYKFGAGTTLGRGTNFLAAQVRYEL